MKLISMTDFVLKMKYPQNKEEAENESYLYY